MRIISCPLGVLEVQMMTETFGGLSSIKGSKSDSLNFRANRTNHPFSNSDSRLGFVCRRNARRSTLFATSTNQRFDRNLRYSHHGLQMTRYNPYRPSLCHFDDWSYRCTSRQNPRRRETCHGRHRGYRPLSVPIPSAIFCLRVAVGVTRARPVNKTRSAFSEVFAPATNRDS